MQKQSLATSHKETDAQTVCATPTLEDETSPPGFIAERISLLSLGLWKTEKASTLCKHCSARAKTLVCYRHCFSHKSESWHHTGCCKEN